MSDVHKISLHLASQQRTGSRKGVRTTEGRGLDASLCTLDVLMLHFQSLNCLIKFLFVRNRCVAAAMDTHL